MENRKKLKICFMGGNQAGIVGVLTVLARGDRIVSGVSYSEDLTNILKILKVRTYKSIYDKSFIKRLQGADLLLSVHGREIVDRNILKLPKYGGINIHPYLYKYKGADPVGHALKDREFNASVGVHVIDEKIDSGRVIYEEFTDVAGSKSADEVYNKLYPYYCKVILKALTRIENGSKKDKK